MEHLVGLHTGQHGMVGAVIRKDFDDVESVAETLPSPVDMEPVDSIVAVNQERMQGTFYAVLSAAWHHSGMAELIFQRVDPLVGRHAVAVKHLYIVAESEITPKGVLQTVGGIRIVAGERGGAAVGTILRLGGHPTVEEQLGHGVPSVPVGIPVQGIGHQAPLVGGGAKVGVQHAVSGVGITMCAHACGSVLPIAQHLGQRHGRVTRTGMGAGRAVVRA